MRRDDDVFVDVAELHLHRRNAQAFERDGDDHPAGASDRAGWRHWRCQRTRETLRHDREGGGAGSKKRSIIAGLRTSTSMPVEGEKQRALTRGPVVVGNQVKADPPVGMRHICIPSRLSTVSGGAIAVLAGIRGRGLENPRSSDPPDWNGPREAGRPSVHRAVR